jgi:hypothetical protein
MSEPTTIKVEMRSADAERRRLRALLDNFEAEHGLPSSRLLEAFMGPDGKLHETEEFHAWHEAWIGYQILTGR